MKTALITGASSGLGLEFAKLFAKDGHSLILVARRRDALETAAKELRAQNSAIRVDVIDHDLGQPGAGEALFRKVKALGLDVDFLVNNAGFGTQGEFAKLPLARELEMVDLNIRALVELTHFFLPAMLGRRSGKILQVGSTAGFQPGPYMTTYYASKAFVNSFAEGLHEELKGTGVSMTVLAPGATATGFQGAAGMESSRLFNTGLIASSAEVARKGYRAMLAGRAMIVPGPLNWIMVQAVRLTPRWLARALAGYLNSNK